MEADRMNFAKNNTSNLNNREKKVEPKTIDTHTHTEQTKRDSSKSTTHDDDDDKNTKNIELLFEERRKNEKNTKKKKEYLYQPAKAVR